MVTPSRYVTICYTYGNRCVPEIAPFRNHYHRNHLYNPFVTIEKCRIPHKTAGYVKKTGWLRRNNGYVDNCRNHAVQLVTSNHYLHNHPKIEMITY